MFVIHFERLNILIICQDFIPRILNPLKCTYVCYFEFAYCILHSFNVKSMISYIFKLKFNES